MTFWLTKIQFHRIILAVKINSYNQLSGFVVVSIFLILYTYIHVFICMYMCFHMHGYLSTTCTQYIMDIRKWHQVPWNWSYRWLLVIMWALEIEHLSPRRAASVLNHRTIFLLLVCLLLKFLLDWWYSLKIPHTCLSNELIIMVII